MPEYVSSSAVVRLEAAGRRAGVRVLVSRASSRVLVGGHERELEVDGDVQRDTGARQRPHRRPSSAFAARREQHAPLDLLELRLDVRGASRAVAGAVARDHLVELLAGDVPAAPEAGLLDFVNVDAHLRLLPETEKGPHYRGRSREVKARRAKRARLAADPPSPGGRRRA